MIEKIDEEVKRKKCLTSLLQDCTMYDLLNIHSDDSVKTLQIEETAVFSALQNLFPLQIEPYHSDPRFMPVQTLGIDRTAR